MTKTIGTTLRLTALMLGCQSVAAPERCSERGAVSVLWKTHTRRSRSSTRLAFAFRESHPKAPPFEHYGEAAVSAALMRPSTLRGRDRRCEWRLERIHPTQVNLRHKPVPESKG
jgi:hypothetical protein